jgi:Asp-tRNA(Asn)/Glu-tRNA(Gln) amidotransferase A subunit family amidase
MFFWPRLSHCHHATWCSKEYGRPFGLAIMARAGREDILFTFMSAFEATFPKRVIPTSLLQPI